MRKQKHHHSGGVVTLHGRFENVSLFGMVLPQWGRWAIDFLDHRAGAGGWGDRGGPVDGMWACRLDSCFLHEYPIKREDSTSSSVVVASAMPLLQLK